MDERHAGQISHTSSSRQRPPPTKTISFSSLAGVSTTTHSSSSPSPHSASASASLSPSFPASSSSHRESLRPPNFPAPLLSVRPPQSFLLRPQGTSSTGFFRRHYESLESEGLSEEDEEGAVVEQQRINIEGREESGSGRRNCSSSGSHSPDSGGFTTPYRMPSEEALTPNLPLSSPSSKCSLSIVGSNAAVSTSFAAPSFSPPVAPSFPTSSSSFSSAPSVSVDISGAATMLDSFLCSADRAVSSVSRSSYPGAGGEKAGSATTGGSSSNLRKTKGTSAAMANDNRDVGSGRDSVGGGSRSGGGSIGGRMNSPVRGIGQESQGYLFSHSINADDSVDDCFVIGCTSGNANESSHVPVRSPPRTVANSRESRNTNISRDAGVKPPRSGVACSNGKIYIGNNTEQSGCRVSEENRRKSRSRSGRGSKATGDVRRWNSAVASEKETTLTKGKRDAISCGRSSGSIGDKKQHTPSRYNSSEGRSQSSSEHYDNDGIIWSWRRIPKMFKIPLPSSHVTSETTSSTGGTASPAPMRAVVIDGLDIALNHGRNGKLSPKGLEAAVMWFAERGHPISVAVPSWMIDGAMRDNESMYEEDPNHAVNMLLAMQEDRFLYELTDHLTGPALTPKGVRDMVRLCNVNDGILCTNNSRMFKDFSQRYRKAYERIKNCQLMYSFDVDHFCPCHDQGKEGPLAAELLFR